MNKDKNRPSRVLVVCMGNICRSPTAEAVLKKEAQKQQVEIEIDSAGTIGFHAGSKPDPRSMAAGELRGYDFNGMSSRQVTTADFGHFDYILAADKDNLKDLMAMCPPQYEHKLALLLSYGETQYEEVPDPYYGDGNGFELVLDLIEQASVDFINKIKA